MSAHKDEESGKWECNFYYTDWTGKQLRKHKRGFNTKKEALNYETEFKRVAKANMDMKMSSFVKIYLEDKKGELKKRTMRNKIYMINSHIIPYFGEKAMNSITPSDIIAWQNEIKEKENFSESYLRMIQNALTALFTHAKKIYSLENNPCSRVKKMGRSDNRSLTFWMYEEYQKFISTFEPTSMHYLMFELLFWTGMREGELLALTMDDFDMDQQVVKITKTYFRHNREDVITAPKTDNSVRTIDLPVFICDLVRDYYNRLYQYPRDRRLFPIGAEALQHVMKNHTKKAAVKKIRVHDLRHSHCAYLINQGVQPLIIKERLGHKDIKVTLNTYGHLYPSEQKKVANLLDRNNVSNRIENKTEKENAPAGTRTFDV